MPCIDTRCSSAPTWLHLEQRKNLATSIVGTSMPYRIAKGARAIGEQ